MDLDDDFTKQQSCVRHNGTCLYSDTAGFSSEAQSFSPQALNGHLQLFTNTSWNHNVQLEALSCHSLKTTLIHIQYLLFTALQYSVKRLVHF